MSHLFYFTELTNIYNFSSMVLGVTPRDAVLLNGPPTPLERTDEARDAPEVIEVRERADVADSGLISTSPFPGNRIPSSSTSRFNNGSISGR